MKDFIHRNGAVTILIVFLVSGFSSSLFAQIRDDESSANYLAAQCALSSGGDAARYEVYCRRLAKTVAFLSPGQQERVFGFVPQPIAFARPDDPPQGGTAQNSGGTAPQEAFNPGGDGLNTVGSPNRANPETSSAEVGNAGPVENELAEDQAEFLPEEAAESEPQSNWWEDALRWLNGIFDSLVADFAERQQA